MSKHRDTIEARETDESKLRSDKAHGSGVAVGDGSTGKPTPGDDGCWRTQDIVFAFGPDQTLLFAPMLQQISYHGPNQVGDFLLSTKFNSLVAVGLTTQGGAIIVYETKEGAFAITKAEGPSGTIPSKEAAKWVEASSQNERLYDFLRETKDSDARRTSSFTIGPDASWFARRGDTIAHHDLPASLLRLMEE